jgi:hypothetical protein
MVLILSFKDTNDTFSSKRLFINEKRLSGYSRVDRVSPPCLCGAVPLKLSKSTEKY